MIEYRPFLNVDPPGIVNIWRSQPSQQRLLQGISHGLFETQILSKPYFEPDGLIVAVQDGEIVGFVHAAFGPAKDHSTLNRQCGIICMMMVQSKNQADEIRLGLLERAEQYLRQHGSTEIYIACRFPDGPFYLGLYGGSQIPGLLEQVHAGGISFFEAAGYAAVKRIDIMQRPLVDFRCVIDRRQSVGRPNTRAESDTVLGNRR